MTTFLRKLLYFTVDLFRKLRNKILSAVAVIYKAEYCKKSIESPFPAVKRRMRYENIQLVLDNRS